MHDNSTQNLDGIFLNYVPMQMGLDAINIKVDFTLFAASKAPFWYDL